MRILCIFLPPVAVYLNGTPWQTVGNLFLCFLFWIPGVIHAWLVVSAKERDDERRKELVIDRQKEAAWEAEHPVPQPAPPPGWSVSPPGEPSPSSAVEPSATGPLAAPAGTAAETDSAAVPPGSLPKEPE